MPPGVSVIPLVWNILLSLVFLTKVWSFSKFKGLWEAFSSSLYNYIYIYNFQIVVLEKTLEIPLDSKEIKPVNLKGNQLWIFTGRTDAEAEAPILWPPDAKRRLTRKDPDAGKYWRQEEKRVTEDGMVG